jgi:hydrogenase nickel incorporation protein HypA/HybF
MHELSIAMSIIEVAEEEAVRIGPAKVHAIHLKLGSRAGVAKDALLFCYGMASEGSRFEGSRLVVNESDGQEIEIVGLEVE